MNLFKTIARCRTQGLIAMALVGGLSFSAHAGNIFITGHDSDEHNNSGYMAAGLDYLLFGSASNSTSRSGKTVAYIGTDLSSTPSGIGSAGYSTPSFFAATPTGIASALTGGFDAVMVGSGGGSTDAANLAAAATAFATYFNGGGSLYINTDEGFGQTWYNFVPSFGTAVNNSISAVGVFAPTAAGSAIGLTDPIVDADITHSFYDGIDTSLFTVFEVTDSVSSFGTNNGKPVAFGLRAGTIGDGGFVGGEGTVPEPGPLLLVGAGLLGWAATRRMRRG